MEWKKDEEVIVQSRFIWVDKLFKFKQILQEYPTPATATLEFILTDAGVVTFRLFSQAPIIIVTSIN